MMIPMSIKGSKLLSLNILDKLLKEVKNIFLGILMECIVREKRRRKKSQEGPKLLASLISVDLQGELVVIGLSQLRFLSCTTFPKN